MKKHLVALFTLVSCACFAQNNIIQINQSNGSYNNSTSQDCGYKINGICSSEDIGGVSLGEIRRVLRGGAWEFCQNYDVFADLKNYNNFTVTVLLKFDYESRNTSDEETYQIVLKSCEEKSIKLKYCLSSPYTLQGMIVRRLRN